MCQSNDFFAQIPFSWKGKSSFCRALCMSLSSGAFICLTYTQVLQEQKIIPLLIPHSPLINCSLLSFKLSTSKLLSQRESTLLTVFSALQLSAPWDADLCMSQGWALQVICGITLSPYTVTQVCPKGWGWFWKCSSYWTKICQLCNFWRFLQNLGENQKESLLYSQNEPALTYSLICPNELFNYQTMKIWIAFCVWQIHWL